jgi:hypothetical protein
MANISSNESLAEPTDKQMYTAKEVEAVNTDSSIPKDADAGELTLDETTAGGLGRHLGVFSTTFLM